VLDFEEGANAPSLRLKLIPTVRFSTRAKLARQEIIRPYRILQMADSRIGEQSGREKQEAASR
jgi:hypothetical protein